MNTLPETLLRGFDAQERSYVSAAYPALAGVRDLWFLMDAVWDEYGCDPAVMDERIARFYAHPVWLLNGLFTEADPESVEHRRAFAAYVASLKPTRIADFGGGFGALARMIGSCCPSAEVHVVEPHPRAVARDRAEQTPNVRYVPELVGMYDVLVATDVFEHVPDPLGLVEQTGRYLAEGGHFLMANCFFPVIKCHLPANYHFRQTWDMAMTRMNLQPGEHVAYGRAYRRVGPISAHRARALERRSRRWSLVIEGWPPRLRSAAARLLVNWARP